MGGMAESFPTSGPVTTSVYPSISYDEFASIFLHGQVHLPYAVAAASVHELNWKMMVAHVTTNRRGHLVASHTLVVCGGITEYYLRDQLWYWVKDLELIRAEVRKQTRRAAGSRLH